MASSVLCHFCLKHGSYLYHIDKSIEFELDSTAYTCDIMDIVRSLSIYKDDDPPRVSCRNCIKSLVQIQWFKDQSSKAKETLEAASEIDEKSLDKLFSPIRRLSISKRGICERELLRVSNVMEVEEQISIEVSFEPETNDPVPERTTRTTQKRLTKKKIRKSPAKSELLDLSTLVPEYTEEEVLKRPALCTICGFRFVRQDHLVVHMRRHTGERPFKCQFCEKGFPRSTDLNVHERYHKNEKTHFCNICRKGFYRPYNLQVHMRVHRKEKPFQCAECPKKYRQSNDLKTHMRKHTGERSTCDICGEAFLLAHHLTQHKKKVHLLEVSSKNGRLAKFEGDGSQ